MRPLCGHGCSHHHVPNCSRLYLARAVPWALRCCRQHRAWLALKHQTQRPALVPAPCWMSYLPPSEGFLAPSGLSAGTRQCTAGQQWQAASSQGPTCTTPSPHPPRAPIKRPAAPCPEGLLKAITSLGTLNLKPPDLLLGPAISPCPQSPLRAAGGVNPLGSGQRAHGRARRSETG